MWKNQSINTRPSPDTGTPVLYSRWLSHQQNQRAVSRRGRCAVERGTGGESGPRLHFARSPPQCRSSQRANNLLKTDDSAAEPAL